MTGISNVISWILMMVMKKPMQLTMVSVEPTSSGGAVLRNMIASKFPGEIIPVNPKGGDILGLPAKTSLKELDQPADLAVVVIRPDLILDIVDGSSNELVWRGVVSGEVHEKRDAQERQEAIDRAIEEALKDFPPGG